MSNIAFSTATALLGSAVVSWLQHAAQNVLAWTLRTTNATHDTHYSKSHNSIAPNAKALNSIPRFLTGSLSEEFQNCRAIQPALHLRTRLRFASRSMNTLRPKKPKGK